MIFLQILCIIFYLFTCNLFIELRDELGIIIRKKYNYYIMTSDIAFYLFKKMY